MKGSHELSQAHWKTSVQGRVLQPSYCGLRGQQRQERVGGPGVAGAWLTFLGASSRCDRKDRIQSLYGISELTFVGAWMSFLGCLEGTDFWGKDDHKLGCAFEKQYPCWREELVGEAGSFWSKDAGVRPEDSSRGGGIHRNIGIYSRDEQSGLVFECQWEQRRFFHVS